jgi:hypothetical protein
MQAHQREFRLISMCRVLKVGTATPLSRLIWATLWLWGGIIFLTICSLNCGP